MQENYPHEIRYFKDGEPVPEGFMPLTAAEVEELEPLSPDERRRWLKSREAAMFEPLHDPSSGDPEPHGSPRSTRPSRDWKPKRGAKHKVKRKAKRKGGRR